MLTNIDSKIAMRPNLESIWNLRSCLKDFTNRFTLNLLHVNKKLVVLKGNNPEFKKLFFSNPNEIQMKIKQVIISVNKESQ